MYNHFNVTNLVWIDLLVFSFTFFLQISGREMFEFNPDLVQDDDDEAGDDAYEREEDDDDDGFGNIHEIDLTMFVPTESDGTGTKAEERAVPMQTVNGDIEGSGRQKYKNEIC